MANDRVRYIKCTNGFFAGQKGQVYAGEFIRLPVNEAMDIIAGGKGEVVIESDYDKGPKAFDVNNSIRSAMKAEEIKRQKEAAKEAAAAPSGSASPVTDINSNSKTGAK